MVPWWMTIGWCSCGVGVCIPGHVRIAGAVLERSILRELPGDSGIPLDILGRMGVFRRSVVLQTSGS